MPEQLRYLQAFLRVDFPVRRGYTQAKVHQIQLHGVCKVMVCAHAGVAYIDSHFIAELLDKLFTRCCVHGWCNGLAAFRLNVSEKIFYGRKLLLLLVCALFIDGVAVKKNDFLFDNLFLVKERKFDGYVAYGRYTEKAQQAEQYGLSACFLNPSFP